MYFGLLPKTRKHRNGPPLSTRASLHARPWSQVDREARQISCPSKQREALAPTKNCVSAASLMNLRKNRGARQRAAHHAIHKGAKLCPSLFPIWLSRREFCICPRDRRTTSQAKTRRTARRNSLWRRNRLRPDGGFGTRATKSRNMRRNSPRSKVSK